MYELQFFPLLSRVGKEYRTKQYVIAVLIRYRQN